MESVFITIHDLSEDAQIRYCSDSIEDILGYLPHEVLGRSCWDYFHPDEIPFARQVHGRSVSLDKASVLNYCRVKHKDGSWIGCECVFTVVYDVLVASTSVYRIGEKAKQRERASDAVKRIFSSSPRDPRYHMLTYLSNKFSQNPYGDANFLEPRAALFLNRFTRTSTVMYATNGVSDILGLQPNQLTGKSFYYCIAENCLPDAVKTLESAKANDSIAYLRFWYRNPTQDANRAHSEAFSDDESDEDDEGGVPLRNGTRSGSTMSTNGSTPHANPEQPPLATSDRQQDGDATATSHVAITNANSAVAPPQLLPENSNTSSLQAPSASTHRTSSGNSTDLGVNDSDAIFDRVPSRDSSASEQPQEERIEIEAVVSCTSDGLVVILRRAHPITSPPLGVTDAVHYPDGLFASPWAPEPVMPDSIRRTSNTAPSSYPSAPIPDDTGLMAAIRDVAVFAWNLTGINGSLADYGVGKPSGDALPPGGLPIWDPNSNADPYDLYNGFSGSRHRPFEGMGEPYRLPRNDTELSSSDDEVLFKRSPIQPPWKRPKRRGHGDAFGADDWEAGDGENKDGGRKRATRSQSGSGMASGSGSGYASQSGVGSGSGPASANGSS